jgi:hypothetical protein
MKIINIEGKFKQPLMECEVESQFMEITEHSKLKLRDKKDVVERYFDFLLSKENEFEIEIKSNFVERKCGSEFTKNEKEQKTKQVYRNISCGVQ